MRVAIQRSKEKCINNRGYEAFVFGTADPQKNYIDLSLTEAIKLKTVISEQVTHSIQAELASWVSAARDARRKEAEERTNREQFIDDQFK